MGLALTRPEIAFFLLKIYPDIVQCVELHALVMVCLHVDLQA